MYPQAFEVTIFAFWRMAQRVRLLTSATRWVSICTAFAVLRSRAFVGTLWALLACFWKFTAVYAERVVLVV